MSKQPSDPLMGLKCFSVGGRLVERRQRCLGMTDEERRWRAQWLKDQILAPDEPKFVPEYYKETTNIFRRLWKTPLNALQNALQPVVGQDAAILLRHVVGKGLLTLGIAYLGVYFFKYHTNDFTVYRTVEVNDIRGRMYPDHPDYPNYPVKTPQDYYDLGFYSSVLCQNVEPPPPEDAEETEGTDTQTKGIVKQTEGIVTETEGGICVPPTEE